MAEEFTLEEIETLDEMHAQLQQMHQIIERQHAQFMDQMEHQRITNMACFNRLDQLIAKLSASGKSSSLEITSIESIVSNFPKGVTYPLPKAKNREQMRIGTISAVNHSTSSASFTQMMPSVETRQQKVHSSSHHSDPLDVSSKEPILLDGCDSEQLLVVREKIERAPNRNEQIDRYIKPIVQAVNNEEETQDVMTIMRSKSSQLWLQPSWPPLNSDSSFKVESNGTWSMTELRVSRTLTMRPPRRPPDQSALEARMKVVETSAMDVHTARAAVRVSMEPPNPKLLDWNRRYHPFRCTRSGSRQCARLLSDYVFLVEGEVFVDICREQGGISFIGYITCKIVNSIYLNTCLLDICFLNLKNCEHLISLQAYATIRIPFCLKEPFYGVVDNWTTRLYSLMTIAIENETHFLVDLAIVFWKFRIVTKRQMFMNGCTWKHVSCDDCFGVGPSIILATKRLTCAFAISLQQFESGIRHLLQVAVIFWHSTVGTDLPCILQFSSKLFLVVPVVVLVNALRLLAIVLVLHIFFDWLANIEVERGLNWSSN